MAIPPIAWPRKIAMMEATMGSPPSSVVAVAPVTTVRGRHVHSEPDGEEFPGPTVPRFGRYGGDGLLFDFEKTGAEHRFHLRVSLTQWKDAGRFWQAFPPKSPSAPNLVCCLAQRRPVNCIT